MYPAKFVIPFILILLPPTASAESVWEELQQRAGSAIQHTGEAASKVYDDTREAASRAGDSTSGAASRAYDSTRETVSKASDFTVETTSKAVDTSREFVEETSEHFNRQGTSEEIRAKVDALAAEYLERLFAENPAARELFEQSYGYGVFEARQISYQVTAGYGYGVAVERGTGQHTYMKMAAGGVGMSFGLGGFAFRLVFFFEDEPTFRHFVEHGYDATAEAGTQIGEEVDDEAFRFADGVTTFKLTDTAYRMSASLTGTRFWPDDALNPSVGIP